MKNIFLRQPHIFMAVSASLFLSFILCWHGFFLNPDGVCYLSSAAIFHQSGLTAAMHACNQANWPFYAVLIDIVTHLTNGFYLNASYYIDAIFTAATVLIFLLIVQALKGNTRVLWFAAFVILFSHSFDVLRIEVIRDHGYWAFYLASLYAMLRYFQRPSVLAAFLFGCLIFIASLFRIEGLVFVVLLPFVALIMDKSRGNRLLNFVTLNAFNLLLLLSFTMILEFHPHIFQERYGLGRLPEFYNQLHQGVNLLHERFLTAKSLLQTALLPVDGNHDAALLVIFVFLAWYFYSIITCLSLVYTGFLIYTWTNSVILDRRFSKVLFAYLAINIVITIIFLGENLFLSSRYTMALILTLMLWVPFGLDRWLTELSYRKTKMQKGWYAVFYSLMAYTLIAMIFGLYHAVHSKNHLFNASQWLQNEIPFSSSIYSNDNVLSYFAHHEMPDSSDTRRPVESMNTFFSKQWKTYDFIAIHVKNIQRAAAEKEYFLKLTQALNIRPIKIFTNHHGDDVYIYKISRQPLLGERS